MARLYCPSCQLDDQTRAVCFSCGRTNVLMGARIPEFKNNPPAAPSPRVDITAALQLFMSDMAEIIPELKCTIRERELIKAGARAMMAHAMLKHLKRQTVRGG